MSLGRGKKEQADPSGRASAQLMRIVGDTGHMTRASFDHLIQSLQDFDIKKSLFPNLTHIPAEEFSLQDIRLQNCLRYIMSTFFRGGGEHDLYHLILSPQDPAEPSYTEPEPDDTDIKKKLGDFSALIQQFVLTLIAHNHTLEHRKRFHHDAHTANNDALLRKWSLVLASVLSIYNVVALFFSSTPLLASVVAFWRKSMQDNIERTNRLTAHKLALLKEKNDTERALQARDTLIAEIMNKYAGFDVDLPLLSGKLDEIDMELETLNTGGNALAQFQTLPDLSPQNKNAFMQHTVPVVRPAAPAAPPPRRH